MRTTLFLCLALLLLASCSIKKEGKAAGMAVEESVVDVDEYSVDVAVVDSANVYPKEWYEIVNTINEQLDGNGETDFVVIDSLFRNFFQKNNIVLPEEGGAMIKATEMLCDSLFNYEDFEESNMELNLTQGTFQTIDNYILWLYEREAKKSKHLKKINLKKELTLMGDLIGSLTNVCDSVAGLMECSGSWVWVVYSNIEYIENNFKKNMYRAMLDIDIPEMKTLEITNKMFDKECQIMIKNYKVEDGPGTSPKDAERIVNEFKNTFHKWRNYRESASKKITDKKLRKQYKTITEGKVREIFVHLKNRFNDMGLMNDFMGDIMIDGDNCTDEELINFSLEERWKEALEDLDRINRVNKIKLPDSLVVSDVNVYFTYDTIINGFKMIGRYIPYLDEKNDSLAETGTAVFSFWNETNGWSFSCIAEKHCSMDTYALADKYSVEQLRTKSDIVHHFKYHSEQSEYWQDSPFLYDAPYQFIDVDFDGEDEFLFNDYYQGQAGNDYYAYDICDDGWRECELSCWLCNMCKLDKAHKALVVKAISGAFEYSKAVFFKTAKVSPVVEFREESLPKDALAWDIYNRYKSLKESEWVLNSLYQKYTNCNVPRDEYLFENRGNALCLTDKPIVTEKTENLFPKRLKKYLSSKNCLVTPDTRIKMSYDQMELTDSLKQRIDLFAEYAPNYIVYKLGEIECLEDRIGYSSIDAMNGNYSFLQEDIDAIKQYLYRHTALYNYIGTHYRESECGGVWPW